MTDPYLAADDYSTQDAARAARKAWAGHGGLQAALRQYRKKYPKDIHNHLENVLKERPPGGLK